MSARSAQSSEEDGTVPTASGEAGEASPLAAMVDTRYATVEPEGADQSVK